MMEEKVSKVLQPLGALFNVGVAVRNELYDRGWLEVKDCGVPIVSIGNLTAGGTGKTPFTALLAQSLRDRNKRVSIISRGYKSALENSVSKVEIGQLASSAERFGDEPVMLAHKLRDVPVFVGSEKLAVACRAAQEISPDIILADDAFQHRRLKRAFDIVLLDATEPWWHFRPLPSGRMREPFSALGRAQAIVLSKANLAEPVRLTRIRDTARAAIDSSRMPVFVEVDYRIENFIPLRSFVLSVDEKIPAKNISNEKLFLFSGIGRPEAFHRLVEQQTSAKIVGSMSFGDHARFAKSDILEIERAADRLGATKIIVTEKDAVKLVAENFTSEPLVSQLEAVPRTNWDEFHAHLAGTIF
jgi:tetraacyldisaccharide 4'-kinase